MTDSKLTDTALEQGDASPGLKVEILSVTGATGEKDTFQKHDHLKVKFTLKKGTHVVKTLKTSLNKKGIAMAQFKHVSKKGKYSITGKYLGSAALKTSSGKDTFTVS